MANILLVHGAIADGSSWAEVIPHLEAAGHNVLAVQQPLTSLPEDIAKVKVALATLPAPVVIVGHSFGGVVITNAAHNEPKVAALVYVAAFGPDEGETVIDLGKNYTPLPSNQVFVPDSAGRVTLSKPDFIKYFCPDVDLTKAHVMAVVQGSSDGARFAWKSGPPAWKEKPAWCIVSEHDQIIQPELELFCAERMKAKRIVKVHGASHAVMVSHPKVVAETILEAARASAPK
ncbi:hypothetical protein BGZ52_004666 [Haplosporangium bisporale]|uniref:AB hydrolase-1 domain-containing protein n=1 Tax=Podila verticillata NRRL 6337 TaxID=1069443 RepID=A0A086TKE6_9FUNG|nr:hypothetical protein BGZ52_004666 [Haplosporangium bisporale]KAI9237743.1 MAG: Alpha/Beta hydrolase protein [Podila humilis]KFH62423.1 hypothetical protein MVEG_11632 [Podila verticillata NRRL 6337]